MFGLSKKEKQNKLKQKQKEIDDFNNKILKEKGYGGCTPYKYVNGKVKFINPYRSHWR